MYDEDQEQTFEEPSFEIMINEQDEIMASSIVIEGQAVKFPNVDLVVDQNGINKISDPNTHLSRIKIQTKKLKECQILGSGSAGQVKRAVYKIEDKQYVFAVKSINAIQAEHRKQLLNDLRQYIYGGYSEYLIEFYTCFFQNGLIKQVIEYMDMGSLRTLIEMIKKQLISLSQQQLATITFKILKGLHYIHSIRHSLHRDIKPENILINSRGQVKITDFGVSKCVQNTKGRSKVGTVTYMSPERLAFDKDYTYSCDIWSLGLVLFELATGKSIPYEDLQGGKFNYFKVSQKIINQTPPELPPQHYSAQICDFMKKCLQKNETNRPSAEALLHHPWILQRVGKVHLRDLIDRMRSI